MHARQQLQGSWRCPVSLRWRCVLHCGCPLELSRFSQGDRVELAPAWQAHDDDDDDDDEDEDDDESGEGGSQRGRERGRQREEKRGETERQNTDMDLKHLCSCANHFQDHKRLLVPRSKQALFKALQTPKTDCSGWVQCTSSGRTARERSPRASGPRASNAVCHGSRARPRAAARHGKSSISPSHEPLAQLSNVLHCPVNASTHGAKIANT